jgi:hypothetical protein
MKEDMEAKEAIKEADRKKREKLEDQKARAAIKAQIEVSFLKRSFQATKLMIRRTRRNEPRNQPEKKLFEMEMPLLSMLLPPNPLHPSSHPRTPKLDCKSVHRKVLSRKRSLPSLVSFAPPLVSFGLS